MKKNIKRLISVLFAGLILCTSGENIFAEEAKSDKKAETVLPSGITVEQFQRIAEQIESESDCASAMIGVFQGDEVLYKGYFGYSDIENIIPANDESVYEWGSISKTFIWVSAMQLWEQGRLDLDLDVREYLPDGFFQHLSFDNPITMINLMNHDAGWQETTLSIWETDENNIRSLKEELQAIEPAQINRPGDVVAYSNYGAAVAGYVIECVSGKDFCDYVHENIFKPLGMEHTAINPAHSDNAFVYEQRKKMKSYRFVIRNCIDLGSRLNYVSAYPAGAATGTLSDMIKYGQALLDDSAPLFGSPETQKMLFTGTHFYGDSDIPTCTHGFWCSEHSVRTYGHTGATTFGQAHLELDPESKTGLAVMINEQGGNEMIKQVPTYVFGELSPDKYASGSAGKTELNGYYLASRSTHRGLLKFLPYLSAVPGRLVGEPEDIGRNLYQIRSQGVLYKDLENAVLIGVKNNPDGSLVFEQPSFEAVHDSWYLVKLCLFTAYVLLAVAAVYLLRIRHKLKKHGRYSHYKGETAVLSGQLSWLISVILLLTTYVIYAQNMGGLPYAACAVIGVSQMICAAVCSISAVASVISLIKEKSHPLRYILCTAGNTVMIVSVVYFEMYRFWGI